MTSNEEVDYISNNFEAKIIIGIEDFLSCKL